MKGVILSRCPSAIVVDISHDIASYDVVASAFALAQSAPLFPAGTIHVAVVDPGVGGPRVPIVLHHGAQYFVGPDNGLLSVAAHGWRDGFELVSPAFRADDVSTTFHGRDVFAAAAGAIAAGHDVADAGPRVKSIESLPIGSARPGHCVVVHVDSFGNLICSAQRDELPMAPVFRVGDHEIVGLSRTFCSVARGEAVAYIGSSGRLEIAIREGNAASCWGVGRGDEIVVDGR